MSFCPSVCFSLFLIRNCTTYKQVTTTSSQTPLQLIVIYISNMGLVVLMAVNIKTAILCDVMPFCLVTIFPKKRLFKPLGTVKTADFIFTLCLTLHDTTDETVLLNNVTHFCRSYYRNSPLDNKVFLAS